MIYDQPPSFAAGSRFQYSNSGMVLLGAVVEKASGQFYRDYLRDHIFKPARMTDSSLTLEDEPLPNRSIGYTRNGDGSISQRGLSTAAVVRWRHAHNHSRYAALRSGAQGNGVVVRSEQGGHVDPCGTGQGICHRLGAQERFS
jgi:CubicO group peptidase (beta-lactamase class C family)